MLFNSVNFAIFFPIVFIIYWFILKKDFRKQNIFLLIASYFFYACWDWRFLFLLVFSTILDFICGLKIYNAESKSSRKAWLLFCSIINVGFLGFFKYYNFFIESFAELLTSFGLTPHFATLNIILPVGISFYTFHGLSYVLDIYNKKIEPTTNWIDYSLFVSFFPLLVAGPIERATHLLPQIQKERAVDYKGMVDGARQVLWGLFKKIVVADGCAGYVNLVFNNNQDHSSTTLILGAIFFAFQIYGDFSGYSDIALGTARLLGIELLQNFKFPYFSRDIAEFWRRWHISLSSWFKDYLYIPLGGSKKGMLITIRNTFVIFLVSGFWHGANWTFLIWGGLHALYIMPSIIMKRNRKNMETVAFNRWLPSIPEIINMGVTFILIVFAWIFFRADNIHHAFSYISGIFSSPITKPLLYTDTLIYICMVLFMLIVEWIGRHGKYALENFSSINNKFFRWAFYYLVIIFMILFVGGEQTFIYFQF